MTEPRVAANLDCTFCGMGDEPTDVKNDGVLRHTAYIVCGEAPIVAQDGAHYAERLVEGFWEGLINALAAEFMPETTDNDSAAENQTIRKCIKAAERYRGEVTF